MNDDDNGPDRMIVHILTQKRHRYQCTVSPMQPVLPISLSPHLLKTLVIPENDNDSDSENEHLDMHFCEQMKSQQLWNYRSDGSDRSRSPQGTESSNTEMKFQSKRRSRVTCQRRRRVSP